MNGKWVAAVLAGLVLVAGPLGDAAAQDATARAEVDKLLRHARSLKEAGKLAEAARAYEQLVKKASAVYGPRHAVTAVQMNNLAKLYQAMGRYAKAEPLLLRSLRILEAELGKDHLDVAECLNSLALLYQATGQHARAESLMRRSLRITEARLGKGHRYVASGLHNLALIYKTTGQYARAEPLYRRALTILEARLGKDDPAVASTLNNLALLYQAMGQYAKAEPLYRRSLEITEARLGKDHPEVAHGLNNLAMLYRNMGRYAEAEALYRRSLKIRKARLRKDHPDVAESLNNLALLFQAMGQDARAERILRHGLKILEARLGKDHPDVTTCSNNLAVVCARLKDLGQSTALFDRARRGARRQLTALLPALSEPEKVAFFRNTTARSGLKAALSLALAHRGEAKLEALSASWLLNAKALDQESLTAGQLLARRSGDPRLANLSRRLLAVRQELARLTFARPASGEDAARRQRLEELTRQEQELARSVRQAGGTAALPDWVEPAELRRALPADAVLIDIAHFTPYDFAAPDKPWQAPRYVAWVTPKGGPVRLVDLGPAGRIDAAVRRFREAMAESDKLIVAKGDGRAEAALREHLAALSRLALGPLLPVVAGHKRWLLSPDGNLWLVPWEALTLADGRYAIEKHQVSYLTSGRDLLPAPTPKVEVTAPLVMADPDFDLDPRKARAAARRLAAAGGEAGTRSLADGVRLGSASRLPGTSAEVRAIRPSLEAYAGVAPRVYRRDRALEAVFKAARNPRVVVLCTHGFFLPDQEAPGEEGTAGLGKPHGRWENPLLRCGLMLAGCNRAAEAEGVDDGILTGLEVVGTDLRGCELVVLSACDTGVGKVQTGEGVAGLRQAFQLAGAQAVVSTLWQVPDRQSARLMTFFFQELAKSKLSKAQALRAAKLKIIAERRNDFAAAHPFFWAAFTLTGGV
jgi:CHAT domain-containing protein/Tfp pilus assembly protein PilF